MTLPEPLDPLLASIESLQRLIESFDSSYGFDSLLNYWKCRRFGLILKAC